MKYSLKEHPMGIMFALALLMLAVSLTLGVYKNFNIYSIIAIVIAGLGSIFLGYSFIYDLIEFKKKKKESDGKENKKDDQNRN
jgi:preprotein translocase subunit SecF